MASAPTRDTDRFAVGLHAETTHLVDWNPRFVAYARAHGHAPGEQLDHDAERWPGGKMTGFQLWMRMQWDLWANETGHPRARDSYAVLSDEDHQAFDAWLESRPPTLHAALAELGLVAGESDGAGRKPIMREDREVFRGRAGEVWEWLHAGCPEALPQHETCGECRGTGIDPDCPTDIAPYSCPECGGTGSVQAWQPRAVVDVEDVPAPADWDQTFDDSEVPF